jgi:uncharacterized protein (TIGR02145 family)
MKMNIRILIYPILVASFTVLTSSSPKNKNTNNDGIKNVPALVTGTVTDRDGNVYKTIQIGPQTWMAENLKTTKYRNGDPIQLVLPNAKWAVLKAGAYCWYNNDATKKAIYGALYNWFAVKDKRNIAPAGWHIPTEEEWATLAKYLGGSRMAGGKLKETLTSHWLDPNAGATNSTGFTALPGGYRNNTGVSDKIGYCGGWWSSTQYSLTVAWYHYTDYGTSNLYSVSGFKNDGFSVRCIKD